MFVLAVLSLLMGAPQAHGCWWCWRYQHQPQARVRLFRDGDGSPGGRVAEGNDPSTDGLNETTPASPVNGQLDSPAALESAGEAEAADVDVASIERPFHELNERIGQITLTADVRDIKAGLDEIKQKLDQHQQGLLDELAPLKTLLQKVQDRATGTNP